MFRVWIRKRDRKDRSSPFKGKKKKKAGCNIRARSSNCRKDGKSRDKDGALADSKDLCKVSIQGVYDAVNAVLNHLQRGKRRSCQSYARRSRRK